MKALFYYGLISVSLQMITFSYMAWGMRGVVVAILTAPLAAIVTSIGAVVVFGSWWGVLNLIILVFSFLYLKEKK